MSQTSFLLPESAPRADRRVRVLVPLPLAGAYDYLLPAGMDAAAGDYVRVPFGGRDVTGVVWDGEPDGKLDPAKVKYVLQKYDLPPLPAAHRRFVERVADWTMAAPGAVLKMSLGPHDALHPLKGAPTYALPAGMTDRLSPARRKIADFLSGGVPRPAAEIASAAGCSPAVIRAMAQAGQLVAVATPPPAPGAVATPCATPLAFSSAQESAADALRGIAGRGGFCATLLDGVTGSGKTEVYFEAVAETLRRGKQALILLPEIALSTQFTARFQRRFGAAPALWHSEVPPAQRRAAWRGVAEGRARVVAGARSALFLPYGNLGLIVVDEEHDASYKQEDGVLYHARDMAVMRARLGDFPVVLASATPSLETVTNAAQGKYGVLRLPARHAGAQLPDTHVVDLRRTPPPRGRFISPPLERELRANFAAGEQSLLFLNRRGYAPLTLCRACGHRFQCPSCTAWLVSHRRRGRLQCHHCGHGQDMPRACPTCAAEDGLAACGPGVERIQEEVQALIPEARALVLASDVTAGPAAVRAALKEIEDGLADIVIGTQIVAKGHHFPGLTLVGVVDADLSLAGGDLRAGERTFQLLHQVAGRAGRGEKPGRVLLQTCMPEQAVIRALAAGDRDRFLAAEAEGRRQAGLPPFGRLAALIVSGPDEAKLDLFCRDLARKAPRYEDVTVLGPAPAPLAVLRGRHRRRFLLKAGRGVALQSCIAAWLAPLRVPQGMQVRVDIDPQSFF